ncbi:pyridoxal phosphate-dependent aminotransferase [Halalkalicoccus subterraneus]|uniref:pyridoxal phosphate-dependent aminotransferase n=1 Tax=Halalkalicoccus subterraneus TaxID=2675002 RepID=UPI000EFA6EC4|nr:pyridoxal phosphate-dependent aminotransferase [Halalkalicoccus subterraneus]
MTTPTPEGRITERVASAERSAIRVMFDMAEAHDGDLVRLEVGEPDFDTPDHIVDAAVEAARGGETHYTSNAGMPALREAIAAESEALTPAGVVVTTGGMEALHLAMLTVVDPGSEVVIPAPAWPNYRTQTRLAGGVPIEVALPEAEGFALDPATVIDAMDEETAAVVLTSPSNPTGRVFDPEAIRQVATAAAEYDAYVIADEVYRGLVYEGADRAVASYVDDPNRVLTVDSCSKRYAMTGWRLGWLAGPPGVLDEVAKVHEVTTACASSVAQHAALAAITGTEESTRAMYDAFAERREYVVDRIASIPAISAVPPEGAFYAFVDVSALPGDTLSIAKRLLREYGVVTAPGNGFGEAGAGYLRVSFANDLERIEVGFDGIEAMVREET